MSSSPSPVETRVDDGVPSESHAILAREAGQPFPVAIADGPMTDPIAEWMSLMELVQILCPEWPVRDRPISGQHWKL